MSSFLFSSKSSYILDSLCIKRGLKFDTLMENAGKSSFNIINKKIIPKLEKFNKKF